MAEDTVFAIAAIPRLGKEWAHLLLPVWVVAVGLVPGQFPTYSDVATVSSSDS